MNPILKEHAISFVQTFIATFLFTVGLSLQGGNPIELTTAFWLPLILSGVRAGVKEGFARFAPKNLGGRS